MKIRNSVCRKRSEENDMLEVRRWILGDFSIMVTGL